LYFAKVKDSEGSAYFAFAALSKLFSLMFFPLVLLKLSMKRRVKVLLITGVVIVLCFSPFIDMNGFVNMGSSLDLYFQRFEFNASIYYIVNSIGTLLVGYNPISVVGPALAVLSTALILLVSYLYRFRNRLAMYTGFLLINTIYLLFSPIVHPWYLVMLVAFSVLSNYRFAIAWSGLVVLSYWAYGNSGFNENFILITIEYLVVFGFLLVDLKSHFTFKKLKAGLGIYS
jgi:alpha-1,6-mannosyltransferase